MREMSWEAGLACAVASSLLLLLSFPVFDFEPLAFVALAPLFTAVFASTFRRALAYGVASAFLFYCLHLFWMNAYLPVVGVSFVTVLYGGYTLAAILLIHLGARAFPRWRAWLAPFIWVAGEYVRSLGFLGTTFGSVGYTQHAASRLIQIADIGGEPLVSFVIVFFNAGLAHAALAVRDRRGAALRACAPVAAAAALIAAALAYGSVRLADPIPMKPSMKISLIQALSSPRKAWQEEKWQTLFRLVDLSEASVKEAPDVDLVVWTETAIRTSLSPNLIRGIPYHTKIRDLIRRLGTAFVIGSPDNFTAGENGEAVPGEPDAVYPARDRTEVWTNSAYFLDSEGRIAGKYDKMKLTPFGEHFPLGEHFPFLGKMLERVTDSAGFTPGTEYTVFTNAGMRFGVVICWEGMYGPAIRRFVGEGAQFIVNISNDMWSKTKAGHLQHFTATKFRAVENRIWFVRAANDGVTAFIDPRGKVVKALPIGEAGYLVGEVGPKERSTMYTRYGEILPKASLFVAAFVLISSLLMQVWERWKKKR
jgi:apolipoprotein N-acyltransferase